MRLPLDRPSRRAAEATDRPNIHDPAAIRWTARELLLLAIVGLFFAGVLALTDAPFYNPALSIDPWLYTGLYLNFDFLYPLFNDTYYAARLPWVIPGYALHALLSNEAAYFVLHGSFYILGALFLFLTARAYLGKTPALVALAALLGSQLYYNAHYWDYVDGGEMTFLAGAFYFGLSRAPAPLRVAHLALAGSLLAAALATHLFATLFAVGAPILYAAAWGRLALRDVRRFVGDLIAFATGFATLLGACGLFALANDGPFLFFMPQIDAATAIDPSVYRAANYDWMVREPRLLAPLVLITLFALLARRRLVQGAAGRFALAAVAYLAVAFALLCTTDFVFQGSSLLYPFTFSPITLALFYAIAAIVFLLENDLAARAAGRIPASAVAAAVVVAALPLYLLYRGDAPTLIGEEGTIVTVAVAILAVASIIALRAAPPRAARVLASSAVVLVVAMTNVSINSSGTVYLFGQTDTGENARAAEIGSGLVDFLEASGSQRTKPFFWYDARDAPYLTGIQSLYYYSYTYVGVTMPKMDADFRMRMKMYKPEQLVLLCTDDDCAGAPTILKRAGYGLVEKARKVLRSGDTTLWVRVYALRLPRA